MLMGVCGAPLLMWVTPVSTEACVSLKQILPPDMVELLYKNVCPENQKLYYKMSFFLFLGYDINILFGSYLIFRFQ